MLHRLATRKPRSSITGTIEVQLQLQTLGIRSSKNKEQKFNYTNHRSKSI